MRNYSFIVMVCTLALGAVVLQVQHGSIPSDYALATALAVAGYVSLGLINRRVAGGERA